MQTSSLESFALQAHSPLGVDVVEAARLAAVSASTIRRAIAGGGLRVVRIGRTVRIRPIDLDAWLVANTVEAKEIGNDD